MNLSYKKLSLNPIRKPAYSVLDKSKIKEVFGSEISEEIKDWKESLKIVK